MLDSERSTGALALALVAAAIVGASFALPWLSYDYSSGRRTAEGGFHDPADTGIVRHEVDYRPGSVSGDAPPTDPARADRLTLWLAVAAGAAGGGFLLMALAELPGLNRVVPRGVSLGLCLLALAGLGAALALTWFWLPDTLSGYGIRGPQDHQRLEPDGYFRTSVGLGWVAAFFAAPFALGAFAFKYQAGATDPEAVERLARRHAKEAAR